MSPAPTDTILRLDRSDREDLDADENDYVLLKVARTDVKGSDLSLNLTATEGLAVFVHDRKCPPLLYLRLQYRDQKSNLSPRKYVSKHHG